MFVTADEFPPFRPDAEVLFGKELLDRGYHVDWIMRSAEPTMPTGCLDWRGGKVWVAATNPGTRRVDRLLKHLLSLRNDMKVFSLTKSGAYDFVQVKDKFLATIMAIVAARRQRIRCFFWLSFPFPEQSLALAKSPHSRYRFFFLLRGLVFKFLLYDVICRWTDHIFVQSEEMKRVMAEKGVPAEKMTPVPMGVDLEIFLAADTDSLPDEADTAPIVLYLGSLDRPRHLEFLLQVFAMVAETHPAVKLYFVGDSEEPGARAFLEAEAARLKVRDRTVFTGFLPRERALSYVRAAAVCVALTIDDPTYGVASSTKLIEYMALNKPVLANTHPDQKQVVEESGAGLCVPWDLQSFADGLTWLLSHPNEAQAMGEKGRDYVKRTRTYKTIADNLAAQYTRLMEEAV